ncbi:MAG: B12-binding domain-containing radical SAM protein [Nitrospirae bacterium]|nr:B12-binding domain-containing radical SAM protein [Nitrospirota bacterium]
MKILLINPCLRPNNPRKFYPIGLGYVATALHNAGYTFSLYDMDAHRHSDDDLQAFLRTHRFDLIAFGCIVTHYRWAKWALGVIRETQPHARIVVGNTVASSIPERILSGSAADVAVVGEGDATFVDVVRAVERGESLESVQGIYTRADSRIVRTPHRPPIEELDTLPYPNRDLFDIQAYLDSSPNNISEPYPIPRGELRVMNITTARGCVFRCTFCYHAFQGMGFRYRSTENVVGEIRDLVGRYGANYVQFWDDLTFPAKGFLEKFCDVLAQHRLRIFWSASVLGTLFAKPDPRDAVIVRKMKESGCVGVAYSIESANADILRAMNKPISREGFANTRNTLLKGGIATISSVVFGYPSETVETIKNTIDYCIGLGLAPSGGFLLPLPGTPMYEHALKTGAVRNEEEYLLSCGDRQDLHVNLTSLSDEQLVGTVMDEMGRCQRAVLGEEVSFANPLKTGHKRSRDWEMQRADPTTGVVPGPATARGPESGSAYTVFDHYKLDGRLQGGSEVPAGPDSAARS